MGTVYEGSQESIERRVAIKVLHPELAREPELVARFLNEARASNRVNHPGIVQVTDHGETTDGSVYIVMEYLVGEDLAALLRSQVNGIQLPEALRYARLLASALAAAHLRGVIHRDLKPANVMLVPDPDLPGQQRTKIMDFGIAKLAWTAPRMSKLSAVETHLKTREHTVMGTPSYMAPEQWRETKDVDAKADVYSLGVMLFQLVSGQLPFASAGAGELIAQHIFVTPPLLISLVPHAPAAVSELVATMLKKSAEERPSMAEVHATISAIEAQIDPLPRVTKSSKLDRVAQTSGRSATARGSLAGLGSLGILGLGVIIGGLGGQRWGVRDLADTRLPPSTAPMHRAESSCQATTTSRDVAAPSPHSASGKDPKPMSDGSTLSGLEARSSPSKSTSKAAVGLAGRPPAHAAKPGQRTWLW